MEGKGNDEEPLLPMATTSNKKDGTSQAGSIFFKAMVGSGILSLPSAFKGLGLVASLVMMALIALPSVYSMYLLLKCLNKVRQKHADAGEDIKGEISYEKLCCLGVGEWSKVLTAACVVTAQLGSVIAYLVFVEESLSDVIPLNKWQILLAVSPFYVGTCWLKDTSSLSWTSTFGNFSVALGVSSVMYYGFVKEMTDPSPQTDYVMFDSAGISQFFGICLFAFSAHAELLMIEQTVKSESQKAAFTGTFMKVFAGVTLLYMFFGSVCYIEFGKDTADVIFQSMPYGALATKIVKVCVSLSLLSQYPVSMFPAFFVIEPYVFSKEESHFYTRRLFRTILCVATAYIAVVLPFFTKIMAFVGSVSTGAIVFVLPCLLHLNLFRNEITMCQRYMDYFIIVFGICSSVYASIMIALSFF